MNAFQCQVHGRDLGRALAAFEGAGFMIDRAATFPVGGGMYALIVYAPAGIDAAGLDFRQIEQRNRQRSRRWRMIKRAMLIVAVFGFFLLVGLAIQSAANIIPIGFKAPAAPDLPTMPNPLAGPLGEVRNAAAKALQLLTVLCVMLGLFAARGVIAPIMRGLAQGIKSVAGMLRKEK